MESMYITIGRQFGAGGRDVGQKVAQALGVAYYDKELLAVAAQESGLSHQFLESYDEKPTSSFLYSLVMGQQSMMLGAQGDTVDQMAAKAQREAILSVAEKGSCIIVGRCADYVLREKSGLLRVFLCASFADRVASVVRREGCTQKEAEDRVRRMDKTRASYYSFRTDRKWGVAENYDLCINTSTVGEDGAVRLIVAAAGR